MGRSGYSGAGGEGRHHVVSSPHMVLDGEVPTGPLSLFEMFLQPSLQPGTPYAVGQEAPDDVKEWARKRGAIHHRPVSGSEPGSSEIHSSNENIQDRWRSTHIGSDPHRIVITGGSGFISPARTQRIEPHRSESAGRTPPPSQEVVLRGPPSEQELPPHPQRPRTENRSLRDTTPDTIPDITTVLLTEMTAPQMLQCLVDHGCADLTSGINPEKTSLGMVIGGSFGDIWSGELHDNTAIAIKVWRFASLVEDKGKSLKRAMREICHWSELDHPHIHKLLGVTVFQGRLGMVSEWMPNGNLREYIQKNAAVDRQSLCAQVTSSVRYLHCKDTVHGDIKACNFLVSGDGIVKLSDFDHSIMIDCSIRFTETSRVGGGTLRWMAPELVIIEPSHQRNKRTDVYALGMTLLEIMTGRVPYELECQSDFQIYTKLSNKVLPKRTEHFADNERGNGMWDLLVRCWDHDPNARPDIESISASILELSSSIPA